MRHRRLPQDWIDAFTTRIGHSVQWLSLAMALVMVVIVVLRYSFGMGAIFAQELVLYLHSTLFLLGAAYTLKTDGHVRVDIFYQRFTARQKAWVNALGHVVFTIPVGLFIALSSVDFVEPSWRMRETSPEPGGIPAVFVLKTLIPISASLLVLQALGEIARALTLLLDSGDN